LAPRAERLAAQVSRERLATEVRRLASRVTHWTPSRWAASTASGVGSRADVIYALVQDLADLDAQVEGEQRRVVPRLPHDSALTDQLRVVAADLADAAGDRPDVLTAAIERVVAARHDL
jgi:hypothetical protein